MSQYELKKIHCISVDSKTSLLFDGDNLNIYEINKEDCLKLNRFIERSICDNLIFNQEDIKDELLKVLFDKKIIVEKDEYDKLLNKIANTNSTFQLRHLTLNIANDCNLNCKYCFGSGGTYNHQRQLMSPETAKCSIDYLVNNSGNNSNLYINFFGGEPLLNFKLIVSTINYCREVEKKVQKKFYFTIVTNGTIINDEIADYFKKNNVKVMLSIDGPKEIHDSYRCYVSGCGSFDIIERNVNTLINVHKMHISARATICRPNINLTEIESGLRCMGFEHVKMTLVDADEDSPLAIKKEDVKLVLDNYRKIADKYISDIKSGLDDRCKEFDNILRILYYKKPRVYGCGVNRTTLAVNYDGTLFPCHRFMGHDQYRVGHINNGLSGRDQSLDHISGVNIMQIVGCNICWARFICGGACMYTRVKTANMHTAPNYYCEIYKGIYELAIYIYYDLKKWDDSILTRLFSKK